MQLNLYGKSVNNCRHLNYRANNMEQAKLCPMILVKISNSSREKLDSSVHKMLRKILISSVGI